MIKNCFSLILASALEGKYISFQETRVLFVDIVNEIEEPSLWLLDLVCANEVDDMMVILRDKYSFDCSLCDELELILGFLYMSYVIGLIDQVVKNRGEIIK